jgi:hypothetical protein
VVHRAALNTPEASGNAMVLMLFSSLRASRAPDRATIRAKIGMRSKELPRILKDGLAKKKLTSKGNKSATTHFAR